MRRLTQGLIVGSIVAATAGLLMGRNNRGNRTGRMFNQSMNSMINMMGNMGMFRRMGKSGGFKNMIRFR